MLIKRIYKSNRGEGKTKWLVENAIDVVTRCNKALTDVEDLNIYYVGSLHAYDNFCKMYREIMHTKCPISRWDHDDMRGCDAAILFTDELMNDIQLIPYHLPEGGTWYITMSAEDFVE